MPLNAQRHAAIALWLGLTVAVSAGVTAPADNWLRDQVPRFRLATVITYAGDPVVMLLLVVTLAGVLIWWREWEAARFVIGVVLAVVLFRWAILGYLAIPRPAQGWLMPALSWSYPSGHTAYAATAAMLLFLLIDASRSVTIALLAWPAIVGLSRIAVGVHWPSDVLGGLLLAISVVALVCMSHPVKLTALGYDAKTVRRQLHSLHGGEVRSKSGADPQR